MLDLEVVLGPSPGLVSQKWAIYLGAPFCYCTSILKALDSEIRHAQVWYSDKNPLGNDMVIKLSEDGIRLLFDSYNQQLKMIEVYEMEKVALRYHGKHFNSPTIPPTIDQIHQSFGPTVPYKPKYQRNIQRYDITWRGLTFCFTADNIPQPIEGTGLQMATLPPGMMPTVHKMSVYDGPSIADCVSPELPISLLNGTPVLQKLEVIRSNGVTEGFSLKLITSSINGGDPDTKKIICDRNIHFGMSCQRISSELGSPSKIFYKGEDKMKIHSPDAGRQSCSPRSDYIFNYFSFGMDLVFDGIKHTLKKVILHTNYPGHYDFNIYMRCQFLLPLTCVSSNEHRMSNPYQVDVLNIGPYTRWSEIEQFYFNGSADQNQKPVVLRRNSSVNSTNPFGQTFCYGIQDMIFEVMKNKHIASIIIYQLPDKVI